MSLSKFLDPKNDFCFKLAKESTFKEIQHLIGNDPVIGRAFEAVDQASWTEEKLRTYEGMENRV